MDVVQDYLSDTPPSKAILDFDVHTDMFATLEQWSWPSENGKNAFL